MGLGFGRSGGEETCYVVSVCYSKREGNYMQNILALNLDHE